jgi:hypothetical protein
MGTQFSEVYDFLLAKTDAKEWAWSEDLELLKADWQMLLRMAVQSFLFPRISLEFYTDPETEEISFAEEITDAEKQVLATYMKHEWLKRSITNWKNIEMLYHDKDFKISGKAAHLNALINLESVYDEECKKVVNKYSRKVFDYTNLAGGN